MKKTYQFTFYFLTTVVVLVIFISCNSSDYVTADATITKDKEDALFVDTSKIPHDKFGEQVRYGRELMVNTAYYIGPNGINGKYSGNKMTCGNCHQDAGVKLYSFNLLTAHENYPQYRAREGKVLTLAERINNCIMRPLNGKPLALDGKEMIGILCYLKWINTFVPKGKIFNGAKNLEVAFPLVAANPEHGAALFTEHCVRCHGADGEGLMDAENITFKYPPLWGANSYQPGSSMHRVIKQAQWLKANMPQDKALFNKPFLTDEEALDLAAFVNEDEHKRPGVKDFDYPHIEEKAIDYSIAPFVDTFSVAQHKFGPYQTIISFWKSKNLKPVY